MTTNPTTPLQNLEAEQAVLGALFLRRRVMDDLADKIRPEDFYSPAHAAIFRAALDLYKANTPIDLLTIGDCLTERKQLDMVGGPVYLAELACSPVSAANALHHAKIVSEHAMRRDIEARCLDMLQGVRNPSVTVQGLVGSSTSALASIAGRISSGEVSAAPDVIHALMKDIEARQADPSKGRGVTTGYVSLDAVLHGWHPSDLIIIAGRPGMGKTSFAVCAAVRGAQAGHPALIFSLEMTKEQLVGRMVCSLASVNTHRLRSSSPFTPDEMNRLKVAARRVQDIPLYIDDSPAMRLMELQAKARRYVREKGVQVVYVDYLSLVRPDATSDRSREQEVSGISAGLKSLAKELNVPVIALAQLNREVEKRKTGEPVLSDLRESGAIEQDADVVAFVHNETFARNGKHMEISPCHVLVKKHRHGPCGRASLMYRSSFTSFEDQSPVEDWNR